LVAATRVSKTPSFLTPDLHPALPWVHETQKNKGHSSGRLHFDAQVSRQKTPCTSVSEHRNCDVLKACNCILTNFSDLSATPCGRPYDAVTQLREIPACKSSFLEVHPAQGVTTWVLTHAPQPLVTRLGCVSAFLSYHARGLPLGRGPLPGRICPRDYPYTSCMSTSRVRLLPTGTRNMAFKPPGAQGPHLATPIPGDAHAWRCSKWSTH